MRADLVERSALQFARPLRGRLALVLAAAGVVLALLLAYRSLLERPFAADDYQWLLNVRGLALGELLARAFDLGAQSHFFRPLVWLLFWLQVRLFSVDPLGFHCVSLLLHALNAGLLGALALRLGASRWAALLAAAVLALHPAPFEAVVWVSAQSELLAAMLLLLMLHLWLPLRARAAHAHTWRPLRAGSCLVMATLALALALLAKESAVIGLGLLVVLGAGRAPGLRARATLYLPPLLLTGAYVLLQARIEQENYLLQSGGYGFGPQIVLNPLRSLALVVAPLPGTEHASAAWLVPLGTLLALLLLVLLLRGSGGARRLVLALALTLLPTAPFASPPDSRYLYLPVAAAALLLAMGLTRVARAVWHLALAGAARVLGPAVACLIMATLAWAAVSELAAREARFAAASGPGGSLWRLLEGVCAPAPPDRVVVIDPPLAAQHAEAIVYLACGKDLRVRVVQRENIVRPIKPGAVVIGFPHGSAVIEERT